MYIYSVGACGVEERDVKLRLCHARENKPRLEAVFRSPVLINMLAQIEDVVLLISTIYAGS